MCKISAKNEQLISNITVLKCEKDIKVNANMLCPLEHMWYDDIHLSCTNYTQVTMASQRLLGD